MNALYSAHVGSAHVCTRFNWQLLYVQSGIHFIAVRKFLKHTETKSYPLDAAAAAVRPGLQFGKLQFIFCIYVNNTVGCLLPAG